MEWKEKREEDIVQCWSSSHYGDYNSAHYPTGFRVSKRCAGVVGYNTTRPEAHLL